jgi:hypothetical protein
MIFSTQFAIFEENKFFSVRWDSEYLKVKNAGNRGFF